MVRPQPGKLKNSIISGGASPSTPQVVSLFCAEIPTRDAAAMKKFKVDFEGGQLGESTVRLFKKCYMGELKAWHS